PRSPSGVAYITASAQGPNKPMAFYTKPLRAYRELFGVIDHGDARKDYLAQSDILDFFAEDAKRLRSSVAAPEREQLDRYLNAFESVRDSRHGIEAMSDQLKRFAPPMPGEIEAKQVMQIGEANAQIAAASLLSGLTNVVTLQ